MEIQHLAEAEPETVTGDVQESTAHRRGGMVGDIGDQVVTVSEVTFHPGERTKFHKHEYGQVLYVTRGRGFVGTRDEEREVTQGDLIFFSPGEEHWHGTGPDQTEDLSHLTYVVRDDPDTGTVPVE